MESPLPLGGGVGFAGAVGASPRVPLPELAGFVGASPSEIGTRAVARVDFFGLSAMLFLPYATFAIANQVMNAIPATTRSAQDRFSHLFGRLPQFYKDEAELRAIWSLPDTRKLLLQGLAEKGFGADQLTEMQRIIDAENSDLFDVLAYVAYALPPITREQRATSAKVVISERFTSKQQAFLSFVLSHYVRVGVEELDLEKLTPLLRLKYNDSIADAVHDLGDAEMIRLTFVGFQKYLYGEVAI